MTRKTKAIIAIMISLVLTLATTACGSQNNSAEEPAEPESATETKTEGEYDIASNLKETVSEDTKTIETDHFILTLSLPDTWTYEQDSSTSITFHNIAGREAGGGGRLFSLVAYEPDDTSYENSPHFSVVGEAGSKVYVAEYPSDVQADIEVEEHMEQYQTVYAEVSKIEEKASDSPLTLKN